MIITNIFMMIINTNTCSMLRCDQIPQCPHGEDEEGCHIPESARLVMSLFLIFILLLIMITIILLIVDILGNRNLTENSVKRMKVLFSRSVLSSQPVWQYC